MGKFAMPLCYGILRKKPGIKLGAISNTVSNIALTIYNTPNVLPPLILSLSQYGIHTKPFIHLINCLCNLRSLVGIVPSYNRSIEVGLFYKLSAISSISIFHTFIKKSLIFFFNPFMANVPILYLKNLIKTSGVKFS